MSAFRNPLDADEQLALFGENLGDYTDTQLNWLQDSNSTQQQLNFDNLPFVNVLTSFNDAFITVPIEITGSSLSTINTEQLCMAAGVESIFTTVQFQLSSGSTILNEVNNQCSFINPIRKQIEWSLDKLDTYGSENLYSPTDISSGIKYSSTTADTITTGTITTPYASAAAGGGIVGQTRALNLGFAKAVKLFQNAVVTRTGSTGLSLLLKIYLRDIHDVFKNLTFPMINFRWGLQLGLAWPWNTSSTIHSLLQDTTDGTSTTISAAAITNVVSTSAFVSGVCRLYQRQIKLNPMAEMRLSSMLDAGYTKRVHFLETEIAPVFTTAAATTQVNFQIATNSTNVKRVIVFAVPSGQYTSSTTPFVNTVAGNYPWCTSPASRLNAATLLVNQQPLYTRPLNLDNEFFMELRNQLVDSGLSMKSGSLIKYFNWLAGTQLYYVFDLSRVRNRTSTEQPINLYFQGTRASGAAPFDQALDWYGIMEKDAIVDFSVSRSSAQVMRVL